MSSKRSLVVIVCNALDDSTRLERHISSDSPAASRKVFLMARALKLAGVQPVVLSLGRGHADGSSRYYAAKVCRVEDVMTVYAPFSHRRGVSEVLSLFGLLKSLKSLAYHANRAVIFYNRTPAYLPLLWLASYLGYRRFLDLEDGEILTGDSLRDHLSRIVQSQFDRHCHDGALLACSALKSLTTVRPVHCYYGAMDSDQEIPRFQSDGLTCLMSGTLTLDTGAELLLEAIRRLRARQPEWAAKLRFEITGKGDSLIEFERIASDTKHPTVRVHGRTTDLRYREILRGCDVGLSLKPVGGEFANITFPSKVMEFAGSGLLVLSTDISDVRRLLGDGARYLERNDPELLIERLYDIAIDRQGAARCARLGRQASELHCQPLRAGKNLRNFLFGSQA